MNQITLPNVNESNRPQCSPQSAKGMKILLVSENVPPQVNGIARRIGMYTEGLKKLGCEVELLHPGSGPASVLSHVNPWNFTAQMMLIHPLCLYRLLTSPSPDVVHVVMPANLSGMWILAAYKVMRCLNAQSKPALVVSWHCNIVDYIQHFSVGPLRYICHFCFFVLFGMLPFLSDRVLTPTRKSEPQIVRMWRRGSKARAGVCFTGVNKGEFTPDSLTGKWGKTWLAAKEKFLLMEGKKFLIVCVGRLSPEKGVEELIRSMPDLEECALWLVGDGPFRPELERICRDLNVPVKFLGYQSGDALYSAYAVADLFVCPSLTETFGQTVNEALASQVRVALPNVPVFAEAYGDVIPKDAFWKPLDRKDMAKAISKQLVRHSRGEKSSLPDLNKLRSWEDASESLLGEYRQAAQDRQHTFTLLAGLYFPIWWMLTIATSVSFYFFSVIRTLCGGSVRLFFKAAAEDVLIKVQSFHRLPSFPSINNLHQMDRVGSQKQQTKDKGSE